MSNSLPRTMRRNAAMIGSTSRKSGSKVLALTVPSLSAWLLPCVRVTVISLGPAMAGYSVGRQRTDDRRRKNSSLLSSVVPPLSSPFSAALEAALLVHDQRGLHPAWWQVVGHHLGDRLEQLELVAGRLGRPECDGRFERRAARQAAGDLNYQNGGVLWQGEAFARPRSHPLERGRVRGVRL